MTAHHFSLARHVREVLLGCSLPIRHPDHQNQNQCPTQQFLRHCALSPSSRKMHYRTRCSRATYLGTLTAQRGKSNFVCVQTAQNNLFHTEISTFADRLPDAMLARQDDQTNFSRGRSAKIIPHTYKEQHTPLKVLRERRKAIHMLKHTTFEIPYHPRLRYKHSRYEFPILNSIADVVHSANGQNGDVGTSLKTQN